MLNINRNSNRNMERHKVKIPKCMDRRTKKDQWRKLSIYKKNDQECKRTAKANCNELVKIREKELVLKCKQNYRFNWEKSVKAQEKDID